VLGRSMTCACGSGLPVFGCYSLRHSRGVAMPPVITVWILISYEHVPAGLRDACRPGRVRSAGRVSEVRHRAREGAAADRRQVLGRPTAARLCHDGRGARKLNLFVL
jgi:hypothetical protein